MNAPRSGCPINLTLEALGDHLSISAIRRCRARLAVRPRPPRECLSRGWSCLRFNPIRFENQ